MAKESGENESLMAQRYYELQAASAKVAELEELATSGVKLIEDLQKHILELEEALRSALDFVHWDHSHGGTIEACQQSQCVEIREKLLSPVQPEPPTLSHIDEMIGLPEDKLLAGKKRLTRKVIEHNEAHDYDKRD